MRPSGMISPHITQRSSEKYIMASILSISEMRLTVKRISLFFAVKQGQLYDQFDHQLPLYIFVQVGVRFSVEIRSLPHGKPIDISLKMLHDGANVLCIAVCSLANGLS